MGNKQSTKSSIDVSQLIKSEQSSNIDTNNGENSKIKYDEETISCFFKYCNCFGCAKAQIIELELNWLQYIQKQMERSSNKFYGWQIRVKGQLEIYEQEYHFEIIQTKYLNEIRMIISYYESSAFINQKMSNTYQSTFNQLEYQEEEANTILEDRKQSAVSEKQFFRQLIGLIKEQIQNIDHPCNQILHSFQNYIINYTGSEVWFRDSFRRDKYKNQLIKSTELCQEIIEFIKFLANSIDSFYMLDRLVKSQRLLNCFTITNFLSFVVSVLFLDERVYRKIFHSFQELFTQENIEYQVNLKLLQTKSIDQFDINPQLLLIEEFSIQSSSDQISKGNPSIQSSEFQNTHQPYQSAINLLNQIQNLQSPTNQLKLISKVYKEIDKCIQDYYKKHSQLEQLKSYGTDDIVPILTYIIVKSEIEHFGIILKIIEAFTPKQIMTGILGYYLVTIQGCYMRIQNYQSFKQIRATMQEKSKSEAVVMCKMNFHQKCLSQDVTIE